MRQTLAQLLQGLIGLAQHPGAPTAIGQAREGGINCPCGCANTADVERSQRLCILERRLHRVVMVQAGDIGGFTGITAAGFDLEAPGLALAAREDIELVIGRAIKKNTDTQYIPRIA